MIESMLISVDEPYWNSSVAASMSQTYLQHFGLVTNSGDVPGAFHVLERVRGRTLAWALEDRKAFPTAESGQTASLETDLNCSLEKSQGLIMTIYLFDVSADLKGIHFSRFQGEPDGGLMSPTHTSTLAAFGD